MRPRFHLVTFREVLYREGSPEFVDCPVDSGMWARERSRCPTSASTPGACSARFDAEIRPLHEAGVVSAAAEE